MAASDTHRMSAVNRLIGVVSPRLAMRRERDAYAYSLFKRSLDAATVGPRGINARSSGPNSDQRCVNITRKNARHLYQNKSVRRCVTVLVDAMIGTGVIARPMVNGDPAMEQLVQAQFSRWIKRCDAEEIHDWYGLQRLAAATMVIEGEVFRRYLTTARIPGITPLEIQSFDADMIDEKQTNDDAWINGIKFVGPKRVAAKVFKRHPDAGMFSNRESFEIAMKELCHLFHQERPGQVRGTSWLAPIAIRSNDLDDAIDANLMLQKIAACYSMTVESGESGQVNAFGLDTSGKPQNPRAESVAPGQVLYLNSGEKVNFGTPPSVNSFSAFAKLVREEIATNMNVPYADATGDVSNANFSSMRAARITFKRFVEQKQWTVIIPMMIARDCQEWERSAKLAGVIPASAAITWEFIPPPLESVDPQTDAQTDILLTRAGALTPQQFVARRGENFANQMAQYKKAMEEIDQAELTLSIDARVPFSSDPYNSGATSGNASKKPAEVTE